MVILLQTSKDQGIGEKNQAAHLSNAREKETPKGNPTGRNGGCQKGAGNCKYSTTACIKLK